MTPQQINTLRERFYNECTDDFHFSVDEYEKRVNKCPQEVFDFFLPYLSELKEDRGDCVASQVRSPASVVSHSCTDDAAIEHYLYCQSEIEDRERCEVQCDHCKEYYAPLEEEAKIHESANEFIRKAAIMLVEAEKQHFTDRKNAGIQLSKMFIEKAESLLNSDKNAQESDTTGSDSSNEAD